jgi:hypothetical protein
VGIAFEEPAGLVGLFDAVDGELIKPQEHNFGLFPLGEGLTFCAQVFGSAGVGFFGARYPRAELLLRAPPISSSNPSSRE